jgi:hypothetical protein
MIGLTGNAKDRMVKMPTRAANGLKITVIEKLREWSETNEII